MNTYKTFNTSAVVRLGAYRKKALESMETWKEHHNGFSLELSWRQNRYPKPAVLTKSSLTKSEDNTKFFVDSLDEFPGWGVGDAEKIIRLSHTGWYTDNFQYGILKGAVISIRNPHITDEEGAHRQYMPATYHSDWDGATVYNEFYDSKSKAAIAADHYAEHEAEQCREEDAKDQAEQQTAELKEEIHALNAEALSLIREIKNHPGAYKGPVCGAIKESLNRILRDRKNAFKRIEKLEYDFWVAVENW